MPDQSDPRRSLFAVWRWPWWVWVLIGMANFPIVVWFVMVFIFDKFFGIELRLF